MPNFVKHGFENQHINKIVKFVEMKFEMNLQAEKIEIIKLILETESPGILKSIKGLLWKGEKSDFWETLPQDQKNEILDGIQDIENGDTIDYQEFMEKFR